MQQREHLAPIMAEDSSNLLAQGLSLSPEGQKEPQTRFKQGEVKGGKLPQTPLWMEWCPFLIHMLKLQALL